MSRLVPLHLASHVQTVVSPPHRDTGPGGRSARLAVLLLDFLHVQAQHSHSAAHIYLQEKQEAALPLPCAATRHPPCVHLRPGAQRAPTRIPGA